MIFIKLYRILKTLIVSTRILFTDSLLTSHIFTFIIKIFLIISFILKLLDYCIDHIKKKVKLQILSYLIYFNIFFNKHCFQSCFTRQKLLKYLQNSINAFSFGLSKNKPILLEKWAFATWMGHRLRLQQILVYLGRSMALYVKK